MQLKCGILGEMSKLFVTSDLHFGHNNIIKYRPQFNSSEEHDETIIANWNSVVTKRDQVIVLGDVAFASIGLERINQLNGQKKLVLGNHDQFSLDRYKPLFGRPRLSIFKKELEVKYMMTHFPVHPNELRGYINIHGHVHGNTIADERYINVCLENTDWCPVELTSIIG